MANATVTELHPSATQAEGAPRSKTKDATAALRARRYRRKRKTVTAHAPSRPKSEKEKQKDIQAAITIERSAGSAIDVMACFAAIALLIAGLISPTWQDQHSPYRP